MSLKYSLFDQIVWVQTITCIYIYIYQRNIFFFFRIRLRNVYGERTAWKDKALHMIAAVWDVHGWIWHGKFQFNLFIKITGHSNWAVNFLINDLFLRVYNTCNSLAGYEIVGLENIPQDEPVLFVYYHGAIPLDIYYFASKVFLYKSKLIRLVVDRFFFKIPGWSILADVIKIIPGTLQSCSAILKEGNMLAISPGGVYEAQFGDCYYEIMWKKRMGFAKVALDAKVVCSLQKFCIWLLL